MRFRRRQKLFPGVMLNFSKTGISATVGAKGASVNLGRAGAFLNTGIPGTGLYDRKRIGARSGNSVSNSGTTRNSGEQSVYVPHDYDAIASADVETITCEGMQEFQNILLDCREERRELKKLILQAKNRLANVKAQFVVARVLIVGFFLPNLKTRLTEAREDVTSLEQQRKECVVPVGMGLEPELEDKYNAVVDAFEALTKVERIQDIVANASAKGIDASGGASSAIVTQPVRFDFAEIPMLRSAFDALHLKNYNGGDLYIYPAFVIMVNDNGDFGVIDLHQLHIVIEESRNVESDVPSDGEVIGETWAYARKDGEPDRRYKHNWQIPVVRYARLLFTSPGGLNEAWLFSNYHAAEQFVRAMRDFLARN